MAYADQAGQAGQALFDPKRAALQNQGASSNFASQAMADAMRQWGVTGTEQINQSYEGLLGDMGRNRTNTMDILNQQTQRVGQGYSDAAAGNLAVRDEGRDYLSNLMGSLGFGGDALADVSSGPEALAAKLNERNSRFGQDMMQMQGNWASQHDILYGDQMVNARGAQAQSITDFSSRVAAEIAKAEQERAARELELQNAMGALLGEQGQFELGYANQLMDRDTKVAMQQAEMQQQAAQHASSLALEREKIAAAGGDDSWEREKFYASMGLDREQMAAEERRWQAGQGAEAPNYSGIAGAKQYAADNGMDPSFVSQARQALAPFLNDPAVTDPWAAAIQAFQPEQSSRYNWAGKQVGTRNTMTKDQFADLAAQMMGQYQ